VDKKQSGRRFKQKVKGSNIRKSTTTTESKKRDKANIVREEGGIVAGPPPVTSRKNGAVRIPTSRQEWPWSQSMNLRLTNKGRGERGAQATVMVK